MIYVVCCCSLFVRACYALLCVVVGCSLLYNAALSLLFVVVGCCGLLLLWLFVVC